LQIVGEGEHRSSLERQMDELGLNGIVSFTGNVPEITPALCASDIYILASRFEGFPNVMLEAMAAGLPTIAARCEGGVDDILGPVPETYALEFEPGDVRGLTEAIARLASSPELRDSLAKAALQRANFFSSNQIKSAWMRILYGS
jgi:glycosyltransferase involved in cell wall biosynthesis